MSFINTNTYLALMGVGIFGQGNLDATFSIFDEKPLGAMYLTAINIAGWIPIVNIISGIDQISEGRKKEGSLKFVLILRGLIQISQLSIALAPVDIGITIARAVREHRKNKDQQSVNS